MDTHFSIFELITLVCAVILPTAGIFFSLRQTLNRLAQGVDSLQIAARTGEQTDALRALNRNIEALTHYIRWLGQTHTGKVPPPQLPSNGSEVP